MLKRKICICCACSNNSSVLFAENFEQEQQVSKHTVKTCHSYLLEMPGQILVGTRVSVNLTL